MCHSARKPSSFHKASKTATGRHPLQSNCNPRRAKHIKLHRFERCLQSNGRARAWIRPWSLPAWTVSRVGRKHFSTVPNKKLLHTGAFTHRHLYTQTILHTNVFTKHRSFLHTDPFTHRRFYTQTLLHTDAFYTQSLSHTKAFTRRRLDAQKLLHTEAFTHRAFTHRSFYIQTPLHTDNFTLLLHTDTFTHSPCHIQSLFAQKLLHTDPFAHTHTRFYTQKLLHTDAFTHRSFYTQKLLHQRPFRATGSR